MHLRRVRFVTLSVSPLFKAHVWLSGPKTTVKVEFSGRVQPSGDPSSRWGAGSEVWESRGGEGPRENSKGGRVYLKKKAAGGAEARPSFLGLGVGLMATGTFSTGRVTHPSSHPLWAPPTCLRPPKNIQPPAGLLSVPAPPLPPSCRGRMVRVRGQDPASQRWGGGAGAGVRDSEREHRPEKGEGSEWATASLPELLA